MMYAIKAMPGNLSVIQNTCPNPDWFEDFMKHYNQNLENGVGTYFYMRLRNTGYGEARMFFYMTAEHIFHSLFTFIEEENPRQMIQITPK